MEIPKITALVPMKGHSERVPNKNLRPVAGKPCFHWIIESLERSPYIGEIVINTDSDEIAESAKKNFQVTILERPDYLLGDMVSIQPLIEYDLSMTEGDYYLQTHSTNPLVTTETINNSIKTFFNQKEHDALFTVTPIKTRFYRADGSGVNHDPRHLIRTQDLDPIFEENSCLYIFSKKTNEQIRNRLGANPMMYPMDHLEAVDIDDMHDLLWAEFLLNQRLTRKL
ncbi:acylneuraminate cytidylyltransferase [Chlorobium limicola DSM 245]|uniref:Acylneuraminate cytidylyltransferase n=1 Tax=Chlorobium limicola (strain DSM 245 / NBRC 103803 / 6330) TaxID=290315 RepID=B3EF56_CHLL2|nr:acylneuraminate cytidylyltransferase family protein [Chlorobium limicola]ACD90918.1 acylneuraminate cytidylyltransferase [Chlorobium limicola DSM 245]